MSYDIGELPKMRKMLVVLTLLFAVASTAGAQSNPLLLNAAGATHGFTYVSTAGGAFLEWLEGKTLPGVAVLAESAPTTLQQ